MTAIDYPRLALGDRHEPSDWFAQVGWYWLLDHLGGPSDPADDWSLEGGGDEEHERYLAARQRDHQRIGHWLKHADVKPLASYRDGCRIGDVAIAWPDRVPALKVWSGQQTLAKIVRKLAQALPADCPDLMAATAPLKGASGLYAASAPTALEAGFSLHAVGMAVETKVGCELLAIVGLEQIPITVYPDGTFGYEAGPEFRRSRWRFAREQRNDYYYRFGTSEKVA